MVGALGTLTNDGRLLFAARTIRMFAYGLLSVVLVLYLVQLGLTEAQVGLLLTLALAGDTLISLRLTTLADRVGRRHMLIVGAGLMAAAGVGFSFTHNVWLLTLAAAIGVISPSGNEIGPFLPIEQASLSQTIGSSVRTQVFAWYNLVGSFATAIGALAAGFIGQALQHCGLSAQDSYRSIVICYAVLGLVLAALFLRISPASEASPRENINTTPSLLTRFLGLPKSQAVVLRLSGLFAMDALGGGFVVQSFVAYWFHLRFDVDAALLGSIFFGANLLAGLSSLAAASIARKLGLINTMVFTHLPSNVLLILVPLMPSLPLAIVVLLLRFSISQMDVPTRQAYTMAVVTPDERAAAAGITGVARSVGAMISPSLTGVLMSSMAFAAVPFYLAGGVKIAYDLLLLRGSKCVNLLPDE